MIQYKASNTKLSAKMIMIINKYIQKTSKQNNENKRRMKNTGRDKTVKTRSEEE